MTTGHAGYGLMSVCICIYIYNHMYIDIYISIGQRKSTERETEPQDENYWRNLNHVALYFGGLAIVIAHAGSCSTAQPVQFVISIILIKNNINYFFLKNTEYHWKLRQDSRGKSGRGSVCFQHGLAVPWKKYTFRKLCNILIVEFIKYIEKTNSQNQLETYSKPSVCLHIVKRKGKTKFWEKIIEEEEKKTFHVLVRRRAKNHENQGAAKRDRIRRGRVLNIHTTVHRNCQCSICVPIYMHSNYQLNHISLVSNVQNTPLWWIKKPSKTLSESETAHCVYGMCCSLKCISVRHITVGLAGALDLERGGRLCASAVCVGNQAGGGGGVDVRLGDTVLIRALRVMLRWC